MRSRKSAQYLMLPLLMGSLGLSSACKQIGDESSALMTDAGNKEVDNKSNEQFNLAEWVIKKGIGGANMKNNVKGTQYIFFSSNEEEKVDAQNKTEAAKSKNKSFLAKPEYELRMNATVTSDAKKAEIKSLFWVDGSLNGTKVYAGGNAVEASVVGTAKTQIAVKGSLKAFGKDLISQQLTLTKPFKVTKTINLEHKQTILGIPKIAGVEAGVTFVATAGIEGETDYLDKESVTVTMVPAVKATAGIQAGVKAVLFASATAKGSVTVIDTKLPSSVTLGGRVGSGADFLYGNVSLSNIAFSALNGEIVIGAKLSTKGAKLPAGVEPALWSPAKTAMATIKNKLDAGWEWVYKVWDSPPLINVKFPTAFSSSYLLSSAPKASCAAPVLTKVVAAMQKENAKDTAATKPVGTTAVASLKAIATKAKTVKGTCPISSSGGGATKK